MNKNTVKKILSILLTITFLILIVHFIINNLESFKQIQNLSLGIFALLCLFQVITIYLNGIFLRIIVKVFKIDLKDHFFITASTSFINLIAPLRAGAGVKAIYLKKQHQLPYSKFTALLFGNYIISLLVYSSFALIIFLLTYQLYQIFNLAIFLIFSAILIFCLLILKKSRFKIFKKQATLKKISEGWEEIKNHPNTIKRLVINNIFAMIIGTLSTLITAKGLGIDLNFLQASFYTVINFLSTFITLTPGSLGITEGLYLISSQVLQIPPSSGLLMALTYRAAVTVTLFILGPISKYLLYKKYLFNATNQ